MKTEEFFDYLNRGEIPPTSPDILAPTYDPWFEKAGDAMRARDIAIKHGMWAVVCRSWTDQLAEWIGNRQVLEVMAGRGWLAKALAEAGVDILATDDFSWKNGGGEPVYPVKKMDAIEAAGTIDRDILLMSWPPYNEDVAAKTLWAWNYGRPVIYIGEPEGGCNANDRFYRMFQPFRSKANWFELDIPQWYGLHDYLTVGAMTYPILDEDKY